MAEDIEALARRCEERAAHMDGDVALWELELAAVEAESKARYLQFEAAKSNLTVRNFRIFADRKSALKGSISTCREDAEHYRACAAALRLCPANPNIPAQLSE